MRIVPIYCHDESKYVHKNHQLENAHTRHERFTVCTLEMPKAHRAEKCMCGKTSDTEHRREEQVTIYACPDHISDDAPPEILDVVLIIKGEPEKRIRAYDNQDTKQAVAPVCLKSTYGLHQKQCAEEQKNLRPALLEIFHVHINVVLPETINELIAWNHHRQ